MRLAALRLLMLLGAAASASAASPQLQASLPLGEHFRAGKAVPLELRWDFPVMRKLAHLYINANGAGRLAIHCGGGKAGGVFPWPIFDVPTGARWAFDGAANARGDLNAPLRPLSPEQRLIVVVGEMPPSELSQRLFGSQQVLVERPAEDPLPGPTAAWEAVDGLILDAAAARRLGQRLGDLLAAGTVIVVRGQTPPDNRWPWTAHGDWQVLAYRALGPMSTAYDADMGIYGRMATRTADWPSSFRKRVLLLGVVVAIVLLAVSLLRWRATPALLLVLSAAMMGSAWLLWWRYHSPAMQQAGDVLVLSQRLAQRDTWMMHGSAAPRQVDLVWRSGLRPLFADEAHRRCLDLILYCHANGDPDMYAFALPRDGRLLWLSRDVEPRGPTPLSSPCRPSPLLELVRWRYRGGSVVGQMATTPVPRPGYFRSEYWPAVLVEIVNQPSSEPTP